MLYICFDALGLRQNQSTYLEAISCVIYHGAGLSKTLTHMFQRNNHIGNIQKRDLLEHLVKIFTRFVYNMQINFQHLRVLSLMKISISWYLPKIPRINSTRAQSPSYRVAAVFLLEKYRRRIYSECIE